MPRYRVGEGGVRILPERGAPYSLPPGAVLDELPERYDGKLEVVEMDSLLDRPAFRKRIGVYEDKAIRPHDYEDKSR